MCISPSSTEGEVAAVQPAAGQRDGGRGLGLPVVARRSSTGRGRPAGPPRRSATSGAGVVHDPHLVVGQGRPTETKRSGAGSSRPPAPRGLPARTARAAHARRRAGRGPAAGSTGPPSSRPGRTPASSPRGGSRSGAKRRAKRSSVSGLTGSAPLSAQRQDERSRPSSARSGIRRSAELVGEVGRGRERGPPRVDGPQPALRARQERERRLDGDGDAGVQAEEPGADEPHVVVQRQPARAHVGRAPRAGRRSMARMLASRLSWVSSTPLGCPVLPEVYWMNAASPPRPRAPARRRPGRRARRRWSPRAASGTADAAAAATAARAVHRDQQRAPPRRPGSRPAARAYSSSRSRRTGG